MMKGRRPVPYVSVDRVVASNPPGPPLHFVPGPGLAGFAAGFTGSVTALSAVCLFVAAGNIFYSSVPLHWEMAQRMVNAVGDWSTVKHALDLGCDRGILLNAVALQLKKSGSSGRVVGLHPAQSRSLSVLRTAGMEGVQEYVTCRAGDPRTLPFADNCFDVVASAAFVHTEAVRVLKPGGVGVVWDLVHVPEYVKRLQVLKMEDIRVSERVTAYMASSHIVSFRKPSQHYVGPFEVRLDWRFNNIC
nr:Methyltransferase type 11 [Ipomoea batatas]